MNKTPCRCDPLLLIGLSALPVPAACPIALTAAERQRLKKAAYGHKTRHQARVRSRIVLLAARGMSNARIAVEVGCTWTPCAPGGSGSPTWACSTGRPPASGAARRLHRVAGRTGQGPGVSASRRGRRAAVTLVVPETGARGRRPPDRPGPSRRSPCAAGWTRTRSGPGSTAPGSSSATPTIAQGRPCPGPVRQQLGRATARCGREGRTGQLRRWSHPGTARRQEPVALDGIRLKSASQSVTSRGRGKASFCYASSRLRSARGKGSMRHGTRSGCHRGTDCRPP